MAVCPKQISNYRKRHNQNTRSLGPSTPFRRNHPYFLGVLILASTLANNSSLVAFSPGNKFLYTL